MRRKLYNLFEMSYVDVREWLEKTDIVMVPFGSLEQHGPHLPIGCDSIEAWLATTRAAVKADVPHTPLVWMGYSPQHMRGPGEGMGTITMRASTFQALLYDIGRSLIHHGFNKIVYVDGHTSNLKVVDPFLRNLRYDTGAFVACYRADSEDKPELVREIIEAPPEETPGWHGSEIETSACLLYDEELVRLDRVQQDRAHPPRWLPEGFRKVNGNAYVELDGYEGAVIPMDHHEYSDSGLIGNPFRGSKEKGELIAEKVSDELAKFLSKLKLMEVRPHTREWRSRA